MKIALGQIEVVPNQPEKNVDRMLSAIDKAKTEKVDLIVFPEMSVGGYLIGDKFTNEDWCEDLMSFNEKIRQASNGIAVAYGNIYVDKDINARVQDNLFHPNKDGRIRKYNAIYVYQNGQPAKRMNAQSAFSDIEKNANKSTDTIDKILPEGIATKTLFPNYRIFDDERYFFSTRDQAQDFNVKLEDLLQPFLIEVNGKSVPVGFESCEDLWCEDYRLNGEALNPTKILINNGAEYVLNISASPWTFGKNEARDRRVQFLKEESQDKFVPFLYVNCVGMQNNGKNLITFDGGSTAYNKDGVPVKLANQSFKEELLIVNDSDYKNIQAVRNEKSIIESKHDAIIEAIKRVKNMMGKTDDPLTFIGLSGGIDSAVSAALVTEAIGKEKVVAINMPSKYNNSKTKNSAKHTAEALGIKYFEIPIQSLADSTIELLENFDIDGTGKKLSKLNIENIQAKIRGTGILSNVTSKYGGVFTNNGNKLETMLGYATLYGDVGGAYSVLGDLLKDEIFMMANYINEKNGKEVIQNILIPNKLMQFTKDQQPPSAELREDQIDPMKFGYHDAILRKMLDFKKTSIKDVAKWYLDGTLAKNLNIKPEMIDVYGLSDPKVFIADLEWLERGAENSVFKRVQAPPIIITSKTAYGYDLRESILAQRFTTTYKSVKEKVLAMDKYISRQD